MGLSGTEARTLGHMAGLDQSALGLPTRKSGLLELRGRTYMAGRQSGMVGLVPKWVRLAPDGTNPGLFQIRFQYIWLIEPNVLTEL